MIGTRLAHYEITGVLGTGGMGEVYRARDSKLGRDVALKILPAATAADLERRARFEREARAVAALKHPHIVSIHSIEEHEGRLFLTMELVEGQTLTDLISAQGMNLERFLEVAVPLTAAVAAAHQKGITHRDLKPANVMMGHDRQLKVLDFGLAKRLDVDLDERETVAHGATAQGSIVGTVAYMSPEQAEGKPVDTRSDIFSLGVILYEMATGTRPFKGDTSISTITAILRDDPPSVTELKQELPRPLGRLIKRCLAKDPDRRYQSAQDLRNDLIELKEDLASGEFALPVGAAAAAARRSRKPLLIGGLLVAMAVIAALLVLVLPRLMGRSDGSGPAGQSTRMTRLTNTGKSIEAAISPDGRIVVHVQRDEGVTSLWLTQVSTGSSVEIVPGSDAFIWDPVFDREGEFVYFIHQEKNSDMSSLQRVPVLGGTPRKVIDHVDQTISFSPDGSRFAFVRQERGSPKTMILVANRDGTGERVLATRAWPEPFSENPAWSPDGRLIAAPVWSVGSKIEAYVVGYPAEGGPERRLSPKAWFQVQEIVWLPDGSGLVVAAGEDFVRSQVWELSYPSGAARQITNDVNIYNGVSLTADGRTLAVGIDEQDYTLQTIAADGSGQPQAVTRGRGRGDGLGVSWTPDGRIVHGTNSVKDMEVWVTDEQGSHAQRLTSIPGLFPAVSPDGRSVAFTGIRDGIHIWKANIDGSNPVRLTNGSVEFRPQWSADGRSVVFVGGANSQLFRIAADGGEPELLSPLPSVDAPIVSPDGSLIAVRAWDAARSKSRTFVVPFAGGEPAVVLDNPPGEHAWSPDGRAIHHTHEKDGVSNIWSQPLDGSTPRQITRFTEGEIGAFAWSRDGKRIAMSRGKSSSDVVLITDFR